MKHPDEIITWPEGAAAELGLSPDTLQARRRDGDSPQLYAPTSRILVTTRADLMDWIKSKAVPADYKCREATE
jgi:hypothetical protein